MAASYRASPRLEDDRVLGFRTQESTEDSRCLPAQERSPAWGEELDFPGYCPILAREVRDSAFDMHRRLQASARCAPEVWLLFAVASCLVLVVSFATPPFSNPDEGAHYLRAYEVRKLRLVNYPGRWGVRVPCLEYLTVAKKYAPMAFVQEDVEQRLERPNCRAKSFNSANTYSPVGYLASAAVLRIGDLFHASVEDKLSWARAVNGLLGCLAMLLGLLAVERLRALLALGYLLPMGFWQRAALSVDSLLLSAQFLFVCYFVRMAEQRDVESKRCWRLLWACAFAIGTTKGPYALTCLCTLALWPLRPAGVPWWRIGVRLVSPTVIAAGCHFAWSQVAQLAYPLPFGQWGANPVQQRRLIAAEPVKYLKMLADHVWNGIGWLREMCLHAAWASGDVATVVATVLGVVLIFLAASSPNPFGPRGRLFLAALAIVPSIAMIAQSYISWTPVGAPAVWGMQGRYLLPFLLLLSLAMAGQRREHLAMSRPVQSALGMGLPCVIIGWLAWTRLM